MADPTFSIRRLIPCCRRSSVRRQAFGAVRRRGAWLWFLGGAALCCFGTLPANAFDGPASAKRPKIIPWIEVNAGTTRAIDSAAAGLRRWMDVTDTAIVSTVRGGARIYPMLRDRVPGMRIIPGLKTNDLLKRFDSKKGWTAVVREIQAIRAAGGEDTVLLENESAIRAYLDGAYEIDAGLLKESLELIPKDLRIIWYPGVVGESEATQDRAELLCRAAQATLDVRFTDLSFSSPAAVRYRWSRLGRQRLERLAKAPLIPLLYFYGPGSKWWQDEQFHEALDHCGDNWVIIYPGAKRWRQAARILSKELVRSTPKARP